MDFTKILAYAVVALAIAAPGILSILLDRRRTKALQTHGSELGLSFLDKVSSGEDEELQTLTVLLPRPGHGAIGNAMKGTVSGLRAFLFDWVCTTHGRLHSKTRTRITTIAAFADAANNLPRFELEKKQFFSACAEAIEFEASPAFSKTFIVTGDDAVSIRRLFTPAICDFLAGAMSDKKWQIKGYDGWLIFYPYKRLSASNWRGFFEGTSQIACRLMQSAQAARRGSLQKRTSARN